MRQSFCDVRGCEQRHKAKGFCNRHYQRFCKYGHPTTLHVARGGSHDHPLYAVFSNMLARCYNPRNQNYKYYGGRGIRVCDRWTVEGGFKLFVEDVGPRPEGYQLDRINVNGDYHPLNCRWVNKYDQMANTRSALDRLFPGVTWSNDRKKYRVRIKVKGKDIGLGFYDDLTDAINARKQALAQYV